MPLLGIPTSKAWKILKRDCRAADIPLEVKEQIGGKTITRKTTWHSLRKAYVTNLVKSGLDLKTVMELARHSTLQLTVEVYAEVDRQALRQGAEAAGLRVQEALDAAACCSGVAQKVVGAEGVVVSDDGEKPLPSVVMVGATGDVPCLTSRSGGWPQRFRCCGPVQPNPPPPYTSDASQRSKEHADDAKNEGSQVGRL